MTCLYVLAVPPREFSSANTHVQIKRVSPFSRTPFQRYVYNMRRVDCKRTTLILNFSSFLNPKVLNRGERGGVLLSKKGSWRIWICLTFGEKSFSRLGCIVYILVERFLILGSPLSQRFYVSSGCRNLSSGSSNVKDRCNFVGVASQWTVLRV